MQAYLFSNKKPISVIRDLTEDEKPHQRLNRFGPESLTDAELLAILLQTGRTKIDGVETCRNLLHRSGGLSKLARKDWRELISDGIGSTRAQVITVAIELSRRLQSNGNGTRTYFKTPEVVAQYFGPRLRDQQTEQFIVVFLNAGKVVTGQQVISKGGKTATIVDLAEVMRHAIMNEANSIICVHNHPSGTLRASRADISITKKLVQAGQMLDIAIDDHIIIAGHDYLSMRTEGLIG